MNDVGGAPRSLAGRLARWTDRLGLTDRPAGVHSKVLWANSPWLRDIASRVFPLAKPPILLISLPRSGSSWVGGLLGQARNAVYLREPLTQTLLLHQPATEVIRWIDPENPDPDYAHWGDLAFQGLPVFSHTIIKHARTWNPLDRRHLRLVIKEVNLFSLPWLLTAFRPRVVLLLRHPGAVAESAWRQGWRRVMPEDPSWIPRQVADTYLQPGWEVAFDRNDFWGWNGLRFGLAIRVARESLEAYRDSMTIRYEECATRPLERFKALCEFCQLTWDHDLQTRVTARSTGQDPSASGNTNRISHTLVNRWRTRVATGDFERLMSGLELAGLRTYGEGDPAWH